MAEKLRAIVIGAGIGGLAAALGLQRAGWKVDVYERSPVLGEVGAGLTLWANAIRALDILGLGEKIREYAIPEGSGGFRTWQGRLLFGSTTEELRRRYGDVTVMIHRADLHLALLRAAGRECVHLDMNCIGFTQDTDSVTAKFSGGRQASGDLLLGADGLHSAVRAQLHGNHRPRYAGYTAWRAVVPFQTERVQPGESLGHGARFGEVPMRDGRVYWFATHTVPEGTHSPSGEKAELRRLFQGWHDPVEALIEATPDEAILRNDIYDRPPLNAWGEGRVTLLGDAAHPMTPNLGQGACQALEDAVVLSCKLERIDAGDEVSRALRAYEADRIPRTRLLVQRSRMLGQIGQWRARPAVGLRSWFYRTVFPHLQGRELDKILNVNW